MKIKLFATMALLVIAAAACSSDNEPTGTSTNGGNPTADVTATTGGGGTVSPTEGTPGSNAGGNVITAGDNLKFSPETLRISASATGTKVVWRNTGSAAHTVTFRDNSFNKSLPEGGEVEFTFTAPGTTKYVCTIHPTMEGQVIVS